MINIGDYYIGNQDILKVMQKVNSNDVMAELLPKDFVYYKVRRANEEGIGWTIISVNELLENYFLCDSETLIDVKKIFDKDPNSKI